MVGPRDASDAGLELTSSASPARAPGSTGPEEPAPVDPVRAGTPKQIATFQEFKAHTSDALAWRIVVETQAIGAAPADAAGSALGTVIAPSPGVLYSMHTVVPDRNNMPPLAVLASAFAAEHALRQLQCRGMNAFQALGISSDTARLPDEDVPGAAKAALKAISTASSQLRAATGERAAATIVPIIVVGMMREAAEWLVQRGGAVACKEARLSARAAPNPSPLRVPWSLWGGRASASAQSHGPASSAVSGGTVSVSRQSGTAGGVSSRHEPDAVLLPLLPPVAAFSPDASLRQPDIDASQAGVVCSESLVPAAAPATPRTPERSDQRVEPAAVSEPAQAALDEEDQATKLRAMGDVFQARRWQGLFLDCLSLSAASAAHRADVSGNTR